MLTRTIYGHKMIVPSNDISLAPHLILDGNWERWITEFFLKQVKPGMTVLDIGANCGWYTLLACRQLQGEGKVHSFEEDPFLAKIVTDNLSINGFFDLCTVHNEAVYSSAGVINFHIMGRQKVAGSIYKQNAERVRDTVEEILINTVCLDEIFPSDTQIDFIKMDCEGAELFALEGMKRIIHENHSLSIIIEYCP